MNEISSPGLRLAKSLSLFDQLLAQIKAEQSPAQAHDFATGPHALDVAAIGQDFDTLGERDLKNVAPPYVFKSAAKASAQESHHGIQLVTHHVYPRNRYDGPICPWPRPVESEKATASLRATA